MPESKRKSGDFREHSQLKTYIQIAEDETPVICSHDSLINEHEHLRKLYIYIYIYRIMQIGIKRVRFFRRRSSLYTKPYYYKDR